MIFDSVPKNTRIKYLHDDYFLHDIFGDKKVTRIIIAKILAEYFQWQNYYSHKIFTYKLYFAH
jgi:hypothetical protein